MVIAKVDFGRERSAVLLDPNGHEFYGPFSPIRSKLLMGNCRANSFVPPAQEASRFGFPSILLLHSSLNGWFVRMIRKQIDATFLASPLRASR
jgi:hypothetical protein